MCNKEEAFSLSDVAAINARMTRSAKDPHSHNYAYSPADPIAAEIMREVGVSPEKMRQAFASAMAMITTPK